MMLPELVPLTQELRAAGWHITIETSGTLDLPVACDLMSISPKLSNSTPSPEHEPHWHRIHAVHRHAPAHDPSADGPVRAPTEVRRRSPGGLPRSRNVSGRIPRNRPSSRSCSCRKASTPNRSPRKPRGWFPTATRTASSSAPPPRRRVVRRSKGKVEVVVGQVSNLSKVDADCSRIKAGWQATPPENVVS